MFKKRSTITIQFIVNGIIVFTNNKLLKFIMSSVDNYKIIDKQIFLEEITTIINENNINNHILTDNINIIIDDLYNNYDKENIKQIFKDLSFNQINIINLINIFTLNNHELLIDISNNIIKFYYNNQLLSINVYYNKYKQILMMHLKDIVQDENIKAIKIFGNYDDLSTLVKYISKTILKEVYIYSHPDLMPIKLLT